MSSSPLFYLFTSATVRIAVHTTPKCDTEPVRYVTLHLWDWRGAASLRYRNRAEITVLKCEQRPNPVWFSRRRKSYPTQCEHNQRVIAHNNSLALNTKINTIVKFSFSQWFIHVPSINSSNKNNHHNSVLRNSYINPIFLLRRSCFLQVYRVNY